jgi:hypothetical protein
MRFCLPHLPPVLARHPGSAQRTVSTRRIVAVLTALLSVAPGIGAHAQTAPVGAPRAATLNFSPIPAHMLGDMPFEVSATSASPGAVTYMVLSGPATLSSGHKLTISGGGVVQLAAKQAASRGYGAMMAHTSFVVSTPTSGTMSFTRIGDPVKAAPSSDTTNFLFIDSDGRFFLQNADSQYDTVPANHVWDFYTGKNAQDDKLKLSKRNSQFDTQAMCEAGSPVYEALYRVPGVKPGSKGYSDGNFCDAIGVWVDPDTGDWYAVVHNELYPNIPRVDVISYAISTNHGKTWVLQAPIATSPYGLGNKKDPYYDYGEGDPRLVVDTSSGYFYMFYNSRIMKPSGSGFSSHEWEHVSRAPISRKMAPASWEKYDNGSWSQTPGIAWTCDPAGSSPCSAGSVASSLGSSIGPDNDPTIHQIFIQPIQKQTVNDLATYTNSLLHTASVSWNVSLGKYIAFAEDRSSAAGSSGNDDPVDTMAFYVTDDLSKQKWTYAGSVPYKNASWYRWMVDPGNLTSSQTIGSTFLAYCTVDCSNPKNDSEYIKVSVALKSSATPPAYYSVTGVNSTRHTYMISHPGGSDPSERDGSIWTFVPVPHDDGFFNIKQGNKYLGVAGGNKGRAWGASVHLSSPLPLRSSAPDISRQQWYFERIQTNDGTAASKNRYRVMNRYSGLALSFSGEIFASGSLSRAVTAPPRDWDAVPAGAKPFRVWRAADQEWVFTAPLAPAHQGQ